MTLEDIINVGKKEKNVRAVAQQFDQDPLLNVAPLLAVAEDRVEDFQRMGLTEERTREFSGERNRGYVEGSKRRYFELLSQVVQVQENYTAALSDIQGHKAGREIAVGILAHAKPRQEMIDEKTFEAHNALYKASTNPRAYYADAVNELEDSVVKDIVAYLTRDEKTAQELIKNVIGRLHTEFSETLGSTEKGVRYLDTLYKASDEYQQKEMAYNMGVVLTEMHQKNT